MHATQACLRPDIVAAGRPDAIQIYRQTATGEFEMLRRNRIRGLGVSRDGMVIGDLIGSDGPLELVALTGGRIKIWPLERNGRLAPPQELNAGDARIIAIFAEDFDGDGCSAVNWEDVGAAAHGRKRARAECRTCSDSQLRRIQFKLRWDCGRVCCSVVWWLGW